MGLCFLRTRWSRAPLKKIKNTQKRSHRQKQGKNTWYFSVIQENNENKNALFFILAYKNSKKMHEKPWRGIRECYTVKVKRGALGLRNPTHHFHNLTIRGLSHDTDDSIKDQASIRAFSKAMPRAIGLSL